MNESITLEERIIKVAEEPLGLWAVQRNKRELRAIALDVRKLEDRVKELEEALRRIANTDHRGNRSTESQIAFEALKEAKP